MIDSPKFGLDFVGDIPWGTHLCLFYQTKDDLKDILVPYFAEGLRSNEACLWITSEPFLLEEAREALAKAVGDLDPFIKSGQLFMLPFTDWHMKAGTFNADRVLQGWLDKEVEALGRGFEGLRLAGNTFWIERSLWDAFTEYEATVNKVFVERRIIALCPYSLEKCTGSDVADVIRNHVGTIIKKEGAWAVVEDVLRRKEVEVELQREHARAQLLNEEIERLFAQRFSAASLESPSYGGLTALNTSRVLLDAVGEETLRSVAAEYLNLLNSSTAIYERNGDYALGIFSSGWCRFLDEASRRLCDTDDNGAALASGAWLCHESCWSAAKPAIHTGEPVDIPCNGGLRLYAVPIWAHGEVVGAINFGYGDPPQGERELATIAARYKVPLKRLRHLAATHEPRPPFIVDMAKERLKTVATLLGALVESEASSDALKAIEERYENLFRDSPVAQVRYDTEGRPAEANEAAYAFLGIKNVTDIQHWTIFTSPRLSDAHKAQLRAGKPIRYEQTYDFSAISETSYFPSSRLDVRYADIQNAPLFDADGSIIGYLEQLVDITDRKLAEKERESAAKFPDENPNPVLRLTPEGVVLFANKPGEELLSSEECSSEDRFDRLCQAVVGAYQSGEVSTLDVKLGPRNVVLTLVPLPYEGYVNVYGADVTSRKRAEEELRKAAKTVHTLNEKLRAANEELKIANEELELRVKERSAELATANEELKTANEELSAANEELRQKAQDRKDAERAARASSLYARSLIEASLDPLVTISAEGKITDVNQATEAVTGYAREELIGSDFSTYFTEPEKAGEGYQQVFSDGFVKDYPLTIRHKSGRVTEVLYHATVYRDERGEVQGIFAAARDVTDQKRAQEELQRYSDHLEKLVEERTAAEQTARTHAHQQQMLSRIITAGNEADSLESACAAMLDAAMELINFTDGALFLLDEAAGVTEQQYARGFNDEALEAARRVPLTTSFYAQVYEGTPKFFNDYSTEGTEQFRVFLPDIRILALIPLVSERRVIGHYVLASAREPPFTDEEQALLIAIGQQAGTVIARLQAEEAAVRRTTMLDSANDAIVTWDKNDRITYWNDGAERLYGWSRDEALGKNVHALLLTTFPHSLKGIKSKLNKTGIWQGELTHVTRAGTVVVVESHMSRQQAGSRSSTTLEINTDITNRKLAERQVRTASLYSRSLIEASVDPLVTISAEGKITDVNKATEDVTGYMRDELIGSDFSSFFTEPNKADAGYKQVFAEGVVRDYPLAIRHRSGGITDVLYNATVFTDERGNVQGVFAAARDVTDQKRAEQQVQAAARYARNLIEASLDPLVTINSEGRITDVNRATEEVTGCGRDELIGSDFSTYFTKPEEAREGYQRVFTHGFVKDYPLVIKSKSGKVIDVVYNATVYRNEAGEIEGVFAAARDITDRKRAQEELQRYSDHLQDLVEKRTAQLRDAERLAGIGETAAMIGHDLRNPLQGLQYIVGLQKLRFEKLPPEKRSAEEWRKEAELFDKISEQVYYMDKIVGDLQDYARPLDPERQTVSVHKLIDDVLESLPRSDGKVEINADLPDLTVRAEPHLMHRVFSNLILNAIQAMADGGVLSITASSADRSVAISVSDTGVGIPDEIRDRLFSPLMTGKAKGTGLGLAVVKRIVDAHGGTITFESEKGKGTTFTVTLPVPTGG